MFFYTYNPSKFSFAIDISNINEIKRELDMDNNNWGIIGVPFDSTSSYKSGSRFGPLFIREASLGFEKYNFNLDSDINTTFFDFGDIDVVHGNLNETSLRIQKTVTELLNLSIKPILIGGEHSITLPALKAILNYNLDKNSFSNKNFNSDINPNSDINSNTKSFDFKDITVVHLDAHMDLAYEYNGEKFSHATVMRRISELGPKEIIQLGIRSCSNEEIDFASKTDNITFFSSKDLDDKFELIKSKLENIDNPIYLSVDMDVLDSSHAPSVGNPTSLGISPLIIENIFKILSKKEIIGFDLVEVASSKIGDITSINAAKIILDFLCLNK